MAETANVAPAKAKPTKTATLVYGTTYYLGNKRFDANKPVLVTDEEAELLKVKFVPRTVIDGDNRETLKTYRFKIEDVAGEPATGRTRTRAAA